MKLSRESAYGIEGLLALAAQPLGTVMQLSDIAAARQLPQSFLAKIFQKFAQHGVVQSFRGATRGYALARPAQEILLKELLLAIEGPDLFERCIFWSDRCSHSNPCPLHDEWKKVSQQINQQLLERVTLADLLKKSRSSSHAGKSLAASQEGHGGQFFPSRMAKKVF